MYGKDSDGTGRPVLVDSGGRLITKSNLIDAAVEGRLFMAANQAAVTTTAALATTWTGLGVGNPTGSGKLLVFHEFGWANTDADDDTGVVGLMIGAIGDMAAAITGRCARWGYATPSAYVDDGATIGTPILVKTCGVLSDGATSTSMTVGPQIVDLKGSIVIPAGYALLSYTGVVETSHLIFHYVWEEIDA